MASLIQRITDLIAAIRADFDALAARPATGHFIAPCIAAGSFITNALNALTLGTVPGAAGQLNLMPFIPSRTITVNLLSIEVTTLIAGAQARVGIYGSTGANLPDALLTGQGTLLDCATTGAKQSAIVGGITLEAGTTYWLAVHTSSTATLRALTVGALMPIGMPETGTGQNVARRATATFANGLPANAPSTTPVSANMPRLAMRLA